MLKHQPPPRGNNQAPYKVRLRGRDRPHRPRVLPRRAQVHRAAAARGRASATCQRPHRALQRQEADGAPRLHRGAGGARRSAAAGAGLSADRRAVRQGAAEGRAAGAGARARRCPSGRRRRGSSARGWPDFDDGAAAAAPADGGRRRLAGVAALAAARLRRAAGRPAGARAGAAELQDAARPQRRRATAACARRSPMRCPSPSPTRSARPCKEIAEDMARAAPHAAAAAGRRRLRQDGGGADGHGDRGRGGRAGRADGADRGAGAPACRDHRAAGRRGRTCASAC